MSEPMIVPATPETIAAAADLIRRGRVVAFPTETVYGLGANATDGAAVARVFVIKGRPSFDPLIVHLDAATMLDQVAAAVPPPALALCERFWPGPLTLVLRKHERIADIVTAGLTTVAVRVPDHPVARALIAAAGCPIAAPSANPFGYVSATTAAHVDEQLGGEVPFILDGGPCRVGIESTIVSFAEETPALLRPGGIALEDIEAVIGPVRIVTQSLRPSAPGQLPRHYAPRTPVVIVGAVDDIPPPARPGAALLLPSPQASTEGFTRVAVLSEDGALATVAANLFAALRELDAAGCERIYAVAVPESGLGRAIMDRVRRASQA